MSLLIDELMLECKRKGIKITQKDLAEAAGIGQTAIHKIVRGDTQAPKPQILVAIADCLTDVLNRKITVDDLIAKKDSPRAALATSRNPLKISNWTRLDDAEPVTNNDFVAGTRLGRHPVRRFGSGRSGRYRGVSACIQRENWEGAILSACQR